MPHTISPSLSDELKVKNLWHCTYRSQGSIDRRNKQHPTPLVLQHFQFLWPMTTTRLVSGKYVIRFLPTSGSQLIAKRAFVSIRRYNPWTSWLALLLSTCSLTTDCCILYFFSSPNRTMDPRLNTRLLAWACLSSRLWSCEEPISSILLIRPSRWSNIAADRSAPCGALLFKTAPDPRSPDRPTPL